MARDTQSRKHIITINNPDKKGYTHENIKLKLAAFKSLAYYCMADEIGLKEQTPHTHIFIVTSSPVRHSTMIKRFPDADIRASLGTCEENRAYVEKSGKWADDDKSDTKIDGTFEEWGEMPQEQQGQRTDWDIAYEMLADGCSVMDVIREQKHMMRYRTTLEQTRQELIAEQYRDTFRELEVTYIYGATELGKTRYVMEKYGYENVCQITGYQHGCFDKYRGEDVLLLDEYASSFRIQDIKLKGFSEDYRVCGGSVCLRDATIQRRNEQYSKTAGIDTIRIHDFRHSHVSVLANEGINIQEVARRLGHSRIEMTWNTYSHLYPREEERAVAILNSIA